MSTKIKAADDIRNLARLYKNMESVAAELESIGQLDQAISERKAAIASLDQDVIKAKERAAAEVARMDQIAKSEAEKVCAARVEAEKLVNDAKVTADGIRTEAKNTAKHAVEVATKKSADIIATAQANAAPYQSKLDQLRKDCAAKDVELAAKTEALAKIENSLEAAREKVASFLG